MHAQASHGQHVRANLAPRAREEHCHELQDVWLTCLAARSHGGQDWASTALLLPGLPGAVAVGSAAPAHDHEPVDALEASTDFKPGAPFVEPEVRRSAYGELNTMLRMQYAYKGIGGYRLYMRTYEGTLPGPTLRLKPGDVLRIKLINDMPPNRD